MVTACFGSRFLAATPAMVAAMAACSVSSVTAASPVPAWQPGGGGAGVPLGALW